MAEQFTDAKQASGMIDITPTLDGYRRMLILFEQSMKHHRPQYGSERYNALRDGIKECRRILQHSDPQWLADYDAKGTTT